VHLTQTQHDNLLAAVQLAGLPDDVDPQHVMDALIGRLTSGRPEEQSNARQLLMALATADASARGAVETFALSIRLGYEHKMRGVQTWHHALATIHDDDPSRPSPLRLRS
jgi:hypothetical protein